VPSPIKRSVQCCGKSDAGRLNRCDARESQKLASPAIKNPAWTQIFRLLGSVQQGLSLSRPKKGVAGSQFCLICAAPSKRLPALDLTVVDNHDFATRLEQLRSTDGLFLSHLGALHFAGGWPKAQFGLA